MNFSIGFGTAAIGRAPWQCGYSGCGEVRATKLNGQLHRFCDVHRQRQNQHQRDSIERRRRGEQRRASRRVQVRMLPTGDVWAEMELDRLLDFSLEGDVSTDVMIAEWHSLLVDNQLPVETLTPVEEFAFYPIDNIDDILDLLPTTYM